MLIDLDDGFIDMKSAKEMTNENWSAYKTTHPEVSEFNTYQDYENRHGPLYIKEGESSQIHLSVTDPYFYIKNNVGKTLMYIGNTETSENYNSKYFL
jgi:hypothetical protein